MNKVTMLKVYLSAVKAADKYVTPAQMCAETGLSDSYVRKIAKHLKHAGVFTEHYIKKRTCYSVNRVRYFIMDASQEKHDEGIASLYDEKFRTLCRFHIYTGPVFPSEVRLVLFILRSVGRLRTEAKCKATKCCLVKPHRFTMIDRAAIKGMVPMLANSLYEAKKRMLIQYFYSKLALFEKRLAKQKKV